VKYFVTLGGRTLEVVVDGERVEVEGRVFEAHLSPIPGTPLRHLLLGSESYTLAMERADSGWAAAFRGERHVMEVLDERTRHIRSLTGEGAKATGASQLRAPMPGLVLRIQVQQGQSVVVGQPIVALEAMKMENELRATAAGVVQAIAVVPGQAVERGAVLVEFAAPAT
jgi:pyruvate carboxylase subunit B